MQVSLRTIRSLPKADLHTHIDGSIPVRELFRIAREHHRKLLTTGGAELETVSAFVTHTVGSGYDSLLEDIIERFHPITRLLQTEGTLHDAGVSYVKAQKAEGVVYAEGRFAPQYHISEELSLDDVIESMAEGLAEGAEKYGVKVPLIVAIGRESTPKLGEQVARAASRNSAVVALDLGGPEVGNPPRKFERAFAIASSSGLRTTIHAGEDAGSAAKDREYMREAIAMGADRIGHAIRLADDRELVSRVCDRSVTIEMNPVSNTVLGKIQSPRDLSIDSLLDDGVRVTLNSDDPALWRNGGLSDVYVGVCRAYGFGMKTVDLLVENSFRGSFSKDSDKEALAQEYRRARARLS